MSDELVTIQLDGVSLQVPKGQMLIEAADNAGIKIPRFCYHEKLSIAANCRMCLVEVEKVPKPLPACATPVMEGMVAYTKSPKAIAAQQGTMEFLLINHPLDCPICDQGGECELQDVSMGYGGIDSRYVEKKRVVKEKDIGPLVATDMTRCIHCTRCVRFGDEIAGCREMGATGRGEQTEIGTYIQKNLNSELSGNIIDICPVGALTSKPFRFKARAWELHQRETIAGHDCVGSNIAVHVRDNEVMRVVPNANEAVNECWISDRDRFSYEGLNIQRLTSPKIKTEGVWRTVNWEEALEFTTQGLQAIKEKQGGEMIGALISPNATTEEHYLAQKLVRGLGSDSIDHRLRQVSFSESHIPWLGQPIVALEQVQAALLIGSNIRIEQPMLSHRLRKAARGGAHIMAINPVAVDFNFDLSTSIVAVAGQLADKLASIAKALAICKKVSLDTELEQLFSDVAVDADAEQIAVYLAEAERATVLLGNIAVAHPEYHLLSALAGEISQLSGATLGIVTDGANCVGAWLAGSTPKASGKTLGDMLDGGLAAYILHNFEPRDDTINSDKVLAMLDKADFVVELAAYEHDDQAHYADVVLPITPFTEMSGTFVNCENRWQTFSAVVAPRGDARPGWKVQRVLGNLLGLDGFDYNASSEVVAAVAETNQTLPAIQVENAWVRVKDIESYENKKVSAYAVDGVVRRAIALQKTTGASVG